MMQTQPQQELFVYEFTNQGVNVLLGFLNKLNNISAAEAENFVSLRNALSNPIPKEEYLQMEAARRATKGAPEDPTAPVDGPTQDLTLDKKDKKKS